MKNTNSTLHNRRPCYCPVCGRGRVADVPQHSSENPEICLLKPEQYERASLFVKCPKCKNQIGIGFTVA